MNNKKISIEADRTGSVIELDVLHVMSGLFSRSKVHLSTPHFIVIDLVTIGLGKFSKLFSSKRMFKKNIQITFDTSTLIFYRFYKSRSQ